MPSPMADTSPFLRKIHLGPTTSSLGTPSGVTSRHSREITPNGKFIYHVIEPRDLRSRVGAEAPPYEEWMEI